MLQAQAMQSERPDGFAGPPSVAKNFRRSIAIKGPRKIAASPDLCESDA
jgi:hypothetical protein